MDPAPGKHKSKHYLQEIQAKVGRPGNHPELFSICAVHITAHIYFNNFTNKHDFSHLISLNNHSTSQNEQFVRKANILCALYCTIILLICSFVRPFSPLGKNGRKPSLLHLSLHPKPNPTCYKYKYYENKKN